jgi:hypothetical protein
MFDKNQVAQARLPANSPPLLLVIVDTEEEFDWSQPVASANRSVGSIAAQRRAQEVFARYGVVPTYVIDCPVASTPAAVGHLREYFDDGSCDIGTHLHPWVSPPIEEAVNAFHSYPGNLPCALEREKLRRLTDTITESFGRRPTVYKAGRYGIGANTASILEELGYDVDVSIVPFTDFGEDGGPNFTTRDDRLFWFGEKRRLLEIPLSVGFAGFAAGLGPSLYPVTATQAGRRWHIPGVLARSRMLERIRLTPEGVDQAAHRRLTRSLLRQGQRVFSFTYHSPSLEPGHTPYVRNEADLAAFIDSIESYCDWFINELGGRPSTPAQVFAMLTAQAGQAAAA